MNVLIAGAGRIGRCVADDCTKWAENVIVCDQSDHALNKVRNRSGVQTVHINDFKDIRSLLSKIDIVISCLPYYVNYELAQICIDRSVSMVDLGGSVSTVFKQLKLHARANRKGVRIIPDCGLAPGMGNVLVGELVRKGFTQNIKMRVGGLPLRPKSPFYYGLVFSIDGLVNEYVSTALSIVDDMRIKVKPLQKIEEIDFDHVLRKFNYFNTLPRSLEMSMTSGGTSTLPYSFKGIVKNLNYKTIRYRGHYQTIQKIRNRYSIDALKQYLENRLGECRRDLVILIIEGANREKKGGFAMLHKSNKKFTAMMETTGYSASVVAKMVVHGFVKPRGVLKQELVIDCAHFIRELRARGITINTY